MTAFYFIGAFWLLLALVDLLLKVSTTVKVEKNKPTLVALESEIRFTKIRAFSRSIRSLRIAGSNSLGDNKSQWPLLSFFAQFPHLPAHLVHLRCLYRSRLDANWAPSHHLYARLTFLISKRRRNGSRASRKTFVL